LKRAFAAYEKCLSIQPDYDEAHEYLGEAYISERRSYEGEGRAPHGSAPTTPTRPTSSPRRSRRRKGRSGPTGETKDAPTTPAEEKPSAPSPSSESKKVEKAASEDPAPVTRLDRRRVEPRIGRDDHHEVAS
jgi:hypothetical protein